MRWKRICVRQNSDRDCGAAALATIALCHGMRISVERLRQLTGTDQDGTNLLGLVRAAERLGFSARPLRGPLEELPHVPMPAIIHLLENGSGHYAVLHRLTATKAIVADPAVGIRVLKIEQFGQLWSGYVVALSPERLDPTTKNAATGRTPARRLISLISHHFPLVAEAILCAVLMTLLGLSTSYFIQHLIDSVLVRREASLLNALGMGMLLVVLFRSLFSMLRQYLLAHISRKVDLVLMSRYARHLLELPLSFFETRRTGEILSRMNDSVKIRDAISGATVTAVVDGVLVLLLLNALLLFDLQLGMVTLAFVPLLIGAVMLHHGVAQRRSRTAMEDAANYNAHLVEDASAVETIKAFGGERRRADLGDDFLVKLVQSSFSLQLIGLSMSTLGMAVTATAGIVVLWYGGYRVMEGILTIGQLMFFYTLLSYLLAPLERLASLNLQLQDALVAIDRLYQVLELDGESPGDEKAPLTRISQAIELNEVTFRYGARETVLQNINLQIPAGKTVAIVGESGSGKSTLLKLLMGFYQPCAGRISFDGIDLLDIDLASLRQRIGVVSQDPFIFNGSVRENIGFGNPQASLNEIIDAARAAGLEPFIRSLPERYDTLIGERGANLSGGQRQRLAIARALLTNPDVLIFDEATSHLDTTTEQLVQTNLRQRLAGKTVILVAHRLSTVRDANMIHVMHQGRIVERGTHHALLRNGGRYAQLWQAQTLDPAEVDRGKVLQAETTFV